MAQMSLLGNEWKYIGTGSTLHVKCWNTEISEKLAFSFVLLRPSARNGKTKEERPGK